ncbi:MAG: hypothetical protein ACLPSW_27540 [Roseiarcus sp.]
MKGRHLTIFAVLCLSSAACAQGGPNVANTGYTALAPEATPHVFQSANSCAGDHAEAVWGPGNSLAGYSCAPEENGQ